MTDEIREPAKAPCGSCPYRRDVPAGVWDEEEYAKLPPFDETETVRQPMGLFLCHQADGRVCAGWAGCHDMGNNFGVRLHAFQMSREVLDAILDYETSVPLFASGQEAADHGRSEIEAPGDKARKVVAKLTKKRPAD